MSRTHDERQATEHRGFAVPDETREFPNGRAEILRIGRGEVGHDAWVIGDEPAVVIDWYGASNYAEGG